MRNKYKFLAVLVVSLLITLSVGSLACMAAGSSEAAIETQSIEDYVEVDDNVHKVLAFDRNNSLTDLSGVITKAAYTNNYSAEFSIFSNTEGWGTDFFFTLGNKSSSEIEIGKIDAITISKWAGRLEILPSASAIIYKSDGTTPSEANFIFVEQEYWATEIEFKLKFEILADGNINIYFGYRDNNSDLAKLCNVIKFANNANSDFSLTNGYVAVASNTPNNELDTGAKRELRGMKISYPATIAAIDKTLAGSADFNEYDFNTAVEEDLYTLENTTTMVFNPEKLVAKGAEAEDGRAKISSKYYMQGEYTSEIVFFNKNGGHAGDAFKVRMGDKDPSTSATMDYESNNLAIGIGAGTLMAGGGGVALYTDYDATEAVGQLSISGAIGWYDNQTIYLKLVVTSLNNVEIYFDFAANPTVLRGVIKFGDNANGKITNGYTSIIPFVSKASYDATTQTDNYTVRKLVSMHQTGNCLVDKKEVVAFGFAGLNATNGTIFGTKSTTKPIFKLGLNDSKLVSKYAFTEDGLEDGDTVFELSFITRPTIARSWDGSFGLLFGMQANADDSTSTGVTYINVTALHVDVNLSGATLERYETGTYNGLADMTWKIKATKGGKLEINLKFLATDKTITVESEDFVFGGKVAFTGIGNKNPEYNFGIDKINVAGNMAIDVRSVTLNKAVFVNLEKDSIVDLVAKTVSYPAITDTYTFSIVTGDDLCDIISDGKQLKIKDYGTIKIKAVSNTDSTMFDEHEFVVEHKEFVQYNINETFETLNAADWIVLNDDGDSNLTVNSGLYIKEDFKDKGDGSVKIVSNLKFANNPSRDTVFDITFTSGLTSHSFRLGTLSWGLLFGMSDKTAKAGDDEIGFFKVNYISTSAYLGTKKIEPEYKGSVVTENGDAYAEGVYSYKTRLVAKKDGKLEVYREVLGEKISTLFAVYSGFNFNGHIAFTTDSTHSVAGEKYEIAIKDLSLTGNTVYKADEFEIVSIEYDNTVFNDAIVSSIPLKMVAQAHAIPNITPFKGLNITVVSGSATVQGNALTITGAGDIKIKFASAKDPEVFEEYTFTAIALTIRKVTILNANLFENLTNDSQPIDLSAIVECNSVSNKYQEVKWDVVSGNAKIVLKQLRITGSGNVVLKATAVYDQNVSTTLSFNVAVNDQNVINSGKTEGKELNKTLIIVFSSVGGVLVLGGGLLIFLLNKKRRSKKS